MKHRPTSWNWLFVVAALFALAWITMPGCMGVGDLLKPTARTEVTPGRVEVTQETKNIEPVVAHEVATIEHKDPDTGKTTAVETVRREESGGATSTTTTTGESVGAGAKTTGQQLTDTFVSEPSELDLPGVGGGKGGGSKHTASARGPASNPFYYLAALFFVGAAVLAYFGIMRGVIVAGVAGGAMVMAGAMAASLESLPPVVWVLMAVLVLGGGVWVWTEWAKKKRDSLLGKVVASVEKLPDDAKKAYMDIASRKMDDVEKLAIDRVKRKTGV